MAFLQKLWGGHGITSLIETNISGANANPAAASVYKIVFISSGDMKAIAKSKIIENAHTHGRTDASFFPIIIVTGSFHIPNITIPEDVTQIASKNMPITVSMTTSKDASV